MFRMNFAVIIAVSATARRKSQKEKIRGGLLRCDSGERQDYVVQLYSLLENAEFVTGIELNKKLFLQSVC